MISARGLSLLDRSPADQATGEICQLKITLRHVRPPCWRRILLRDSATLGDLHDIIQIAFDWDGDHLHAFTVGRRQYGDPGFDAEYDEYEITLAEVFAGAGKPISYIYDFGDSWWHDIVLEKGLDLDPEVTYPACVDGRGDAPVEDIGGDPRWTPFDQAGINARLARLTAHIPTSNTANDDIETIR